MSKRVMRYSEAFKQQVVDELESGRFGSPHEASKAYGVDYGTVKRWVGQYGKAHLLRKVVRVEKPDEPGEIRRLKDRIRKLEAALADSVMDQALDESFFELLCERTGTDADAFKKTRWSGVHVAREKTQGRRGVSVERLCRKVGMTRQNYYKQRRRRRRREVDESLVVSLVKRERQQQPRLGCRKVHRLLSDELKEAGVEVGRDRMFEVLGNHGMLVPPLPKAPRTTNSNHSLPVFRNLISTLETTSPNQVWVSDVTYIRTWEDFEYLTLITDLHSHKIVGYHCGESLDTEASLKALDQAIAELPRDRYPIHHSDRGSQFCSHKYVGRLQERHLSVSMTELNHCAENSVAERINGILKQEYGLGRTFLTRQQARRAVDEAVWLYNNRRPHTSLEYRMPSEVHSQAA